MSRVTSRFTVAACLMTFACSIQDHSDSPTSAGQSVMPSNDHLPKESSKKELTSPVSKTANQTNIKIDDGSSAPPGLKIKSYDFSVRNIQSKSFPLELEPSSYFTHLDDQTLVIGLAAESGYAPNVQWNIYWVDAVTYQTKAVVKTSSGLRMMYATRGNQLVTLESNGTFVVYGPDAMPIYKENLEHPYPNLFRPEGRGYYSSYYGANFDLFVSKSGRVYFHLTGLDHRIWNPITKTLIRGKSDFKPTSELPNGRLIAVRQNISSDPILLTLNENSEIESEMPIPSHPNRNVIRFAKPLPNGHMVVEVSTPMGSDTSTDIYEIDIEKKIILRSMPLLTPEGKKLKLFASSEPFLSNSLLAFDNKDVPTAVVFDKDGNILRTKELAKEASRVDLNSKFTMIENGSKILFSQGILETRSFDLMNILLFREGVEGKIYQAADGKIIGGNQLGISILTPSQTERSLPRKTCGELGTAADRIADCNYRVTLTSGYSWTLVAYRERSHSYGSSPQFGGLWRDDTTGNLWGDTIENTKFSYEESKGFCNQEVFSANIFQKWEVPTKSDLQTAHSHGLFQVLPELDSSTPYSYYWFEQSRSQSLEVFDADSGRVVPWSGDGRIRCVSR